MHSLRFCIAAHAHTAANQFPRLSAAIRSHAELKTASRAIPHSSKFIGRDIPTAFHNYLAVVTMERLACWHRRTSSLVGGIQRVSDWICGRLEDITSIPIITLHTYDEQKLIILTITTIPRYLVFHLPQNHNRRKHPRRLNRPRHVTTCLSAASQSGVINVNVPPRLCPEVHRSQTRRFKPPQPQLCSPARASGRLSCATSSPKSNPSNAAPSSPRPNPTPAL
jgi:hypothetical protein